VTIGNKSQQLFGKYATEDMVELDKRLELQFVCCSKGQLLYEVTRLCGTK
jgi:hypothetical protein